MALTFLLPPLVVIACGASAPPRALPPLEPSSGTTGARLRLDRLAEEYFDARLALDPVRASTIGDRRFDHLYRTRFSPGVREAEQSIARACLAALHGIATHELDETGRATLALLRYELTTMLETARFPLHLEPANPYRGFATEFAQLGSGAGVHPFSTIADYDAFLRRIDGFEEAVGAGIELLRDGARTGRVQPRVLVERLIRELSGHLVEEIEESVFHAPIRHLPATVPAEDRERLEVDFASAILHRLLPAYRRLHDFLRDEYLPHSRLTIGLSSLPDGMRWYEHLVRVRTTTDLTPRRIHELGLAEMGRIHARLDSLRSELDHEGTLIDLFQRMREDATLHYADREEMLADFRADHTRIGLLLPGRFGRLPITDMEIRPVESHREQSAPAGSYLAASPDGSRPAIFYLNTSDPRSRPRFLRQALLLHEGAPGHHLQIALQRELEGLPRFRRFADYPAYAEGWALYAESLGPELGLPSDPHQRFGLLAAELWRAVRLVLDTGIHACGWTREDAIRFALRNAPMAEAPVRADVDRIIAVPGQTLAYKVGELRIRHLRGRAEAALGADFDPRHFHDRVLGEGALPLDLLDSHVASWIAERAANSTHGEEVLRHPQRGMVRDGVAAP